MVAWCDIIAECGNYKTGFVATFRRYEGEPTDERDARGRVVKVTRTSFAEHMGIPVNTFHRWVQYVTVTESVSQEARQARTAVSHANVVKNMAKNDPRAFADAVLSAGTSASDQAFHELKLRRAGVDTSRANKKAAEAGAHAIAEPFRKLVASTNVTLCIAALKDATESLEKALTEDVITGEVMAEVEAALEAFQFVLTEARFRVS